MQYPPVLPYKLPHIEGKQGGLTFPINLVDRPGGKSGSN